MPTPFATNTWSLVLPDGWSAQQDDDCVTLSADAPLGALQLSAYFKDTEVTDDDLREFASEASDAWAAAQPCEAGDFRGLEVTFDDATTCWRQWFLRHEHQMLFATYNCAREHRGREDERVRTMLQSLRAR